MLIPIAAAPFQLLPARVCVGVSASEKLDCRLMKQKQLPVGGGAWCFRARPLSKKRKEQDGLLLLPHPLFLG